MARFRKNDFLKWAHIVCFVRSNEYLRLGGKIPIPLLIYRNLGKMLGSLVVLSYDSIELFQA